MLLRSTLLALGLAAASLAPAPALARDGRPGDTAEKLSDPQLQLAVAAALAAMSQSILDMNVEPFARAMRAMGDEDARDLPPDARLGDLAGPGAQRLPGEVARKVPRAMGSAAEMAGAVEGMIPELERTARRLKDAIPRY
jgi:hypothetical protein